MMALLKVLWLHAINGLSVKNYFLQKYEKGSEEQRLEVLSFRAISSFALYLFIQSAGIKGCRFHLG
jgi:hypothetical protein